MRSLVIDSHKGSEGETPQNLHWINAKIIADHIGAKLIWSYPSVNDNIEDGYDVIVFVHASPYSYVDQAWVDRSPDARLYYVTNEYNLGEPRVLWRPAKAGRHYTVIANHKPEISKIVKKYTKDWININLNALRYDGKDVECYKSNKCVYFGSFRRDREPSFRKYLRGGVVVSTHKTNQRKYQEAGVNGPFVDRIDWRRYGLAPYESSLYIEDEVTHRSYNHLANRFYEATSYNVPTIFTKECQNTVETAGLYVPKELWMGESGGIPDLRNYGCPPEWHERCLVEKELVINKLQEIIC